MHKSQYRIFQWPVLFFLFFAMAGCAGNHSVTVNNDSLLFCYRDGKAKEVFFVSSADHFRYHPAIRGGDNVWKVTVPLKKEFTYFYRVDGEVMVPDCPNTVLDDFGSKNCLYVFGM